MTKCDNRIFIPLKIIMGSKLRLKNKTQKTGKAAVLMIVMAKREPYHDFYARFSQRRGNERELSERSKIVLGKSLAENKCLSFTIILRATLAERASNFE